MRQILELLERDAQLSHDTIATMTGIPVEQVREMFGHVAEQAAGEGLAYDFDRLVVANSARAHELLHLAKERGLGDEVKEALLSGHFEHGLDIGDVDALVRVGVAAGLDEGEVRASLADGRYEAAVAADIDLARQIGVTGVPFVVVDMKYAVSGAQPPEVFREVVGSRTTTRGCAAPRSGCSRTRRGPGCRGCGTRWSRRGC